MTNNVTAVVLAAGEGKRMRSKTPKPLHAILGRSMVGWVLAALEQIDQQPLMVIGHGGDYIKEAIGSNCRYVWQTEQLGTGHALKMALLEIAKQAPEFVLVTAADMPLVTAQSYQRLVDTVRNGAAAALLTAVMPQAGMMGRIIRQQNQIVAIREFRDASEEERLICEVNSGVYCFRTADLQRLLGQIGNDNAQGEYYLTDLIGMLVNEGKQVEGCIVQEHYELLGCNSRAELADAGAALRDRINRAHMDAGVTLIDPSSTWIEADVYIEADTVIYPNNYLEGNTRIGEGVLLLPGNRIANTILGDHVRCESSVLLQAQVGCNSTVGPFAHLRPGAVIGEKVRIGDFVEITNSQVGRGSKVSHLTYIGNGEVGEDVNVGCGVVFSNYDGNDKHKTVVGDRAFIGCNTNLVAPVVVEKDTYIAAGSTITETVPSGALAIARERQVNKEGWVARRNCRLKGDK